MATDMASNLQTTFGERVCSRRKVLGLTQAELAERIGIHQPDLCDLEKGRHAPSLATVEKIAKALDISAASLLR